MVTVDFCHSLKKGIYIHKNKTVWRKCDLPIKLEPSLVILFAKETGSTCLWAIYHVTV